MGDVAKDTKGMDKKTGYFCGEMIICEDFTYRADCNWLFDTQWNIPLMQFTGLHKSC